MGIFVGRVFLERAFMASKHLSNTLLYTISSALPTATALAILPFSINLLNLTQNGMLAILLACTGLFQIVITGGTDSYVSIESSRLSAGSATPAGLIKSTFRLQAVIALALGAILLAAMPSIYQAYSHLSGEHIGTMAALALSTAFLNSVFKTYTASLIGQSKASAHAGYNLFVALTLVAATMICSYTMEDKLLALILARAISAAMGFMIVMVRTPMFSAPLEQNARPTVIWQFSWPITLLLLLLWVSSFADRFIVDWLKTGEEVALLDLSAKFVLILDIVQQAMSNAIIPLVYGKENDEAHHKKIHTLFSAFTLSTVVLAMFINLCAPMAISLLIHHPKYAYSGQLIGLLSIGMLFRPLYYFYVFAFYAQKKVRPLASLFLGPTIFQFAITIVATYYWGLPGAAIAFSLGRIAQVVVLYTQQSKHVSVPAFNATKFLGLPVFAVLICALGEFFVFRGASLYLIRALELAAVLAAITWVYRAQWPALKDALLTRFRNQG